MPVEKSLSYHYTTKTTKNANGEFKRYELPIEELKKIKEQIGHQSFNCLTKSLYTLSEIIEEQKMLDSKLKFFEYALTKSPLTKGERRLIEEEKRKVENRLNDLRSLVDNFHKALSPTEENLNEEKEIDISIFKPLTIEDLDRNLSLTIKKDRSPKTLTFLAALTAYTENEQINVCLNSPSSTGKSYVAKEIIDLFPPEDVKKYSYATPTAFFHDSKLNKETRMYEEDLERKIVVFWDQPNTELLKKLRPLLSKDEKELILKITDKNEKNGLRTKTIKLIGFPVVIYCTANPIMDEQELSRFLVLSLESDEEKIQSAFDEKLKRLSSPADYQKEIEENPERQLLKLRIRSIRQQKIKQVKIPPDLLNYLKEKYLAIKGRLQSIDLRDIEKVIGIAKAFALLNFMFREKLPDNSLLVSKEDIDAALELWKEIVESRNYAVTPYAYEKFNKVFLPAYEEASRPIHFEDINRKHLEVYGIPLKERTFSRELKHLWIGAGLIGETEDPTDRRRKLYYPLIKKDKKEEIDENLTELDLHY
jgi:uridine kinase